MSSGITNRGKKRMLEFAFRNTMAGGAIAASPFYVALVTSATAPTVDTNLMSDLTQITAGNGYTSGGINVARNSTDFDVLTEDDTNDRGFIQLKNIVWTASGGSIPSAGSGARYAVLTDDDAVVADREVYAWFDLTTDRSVGNGAVLTLQDMELRETE